MLQSLLPIPPPPPSDSPETESTAADATSSTGSSSTAEAPASPVPAAAAAAATAAADGGCAGPAAAAAEASGKRQIRVGLAALQWHAVNSLEEALGPTAKQVFAAMQGLGSGSASHGFLSSNPVLQYIRCSGGPAPKHVQREVLNAVHTRLWRREPPFFCVPEVRLATVADACHPISKLTSFTGERFTRPGERIWVFGAPYPVAVWVGPPIKVKGEFKVLGIRTGEFLTPAEGTEVAKELQPTGQYDSIRTCDIYPDASDAQGQWRQRVADALKAARVPCDPREEEFGFKRFSRGCTDSGSSIVPFVAVPLKGLEFSSIRKACPLAFVQHTGERLLGAEVLRGPWAKWRRQRSTVCVHQEPLNMGDELCLNMLQFPGFLTDTFLATLGLIKRRRANAESVLENLRLQGYTSPQWLQRCLLLKYPLNYEDICSWGSLETLRLLELVSRHNTNGPRSVTLLSRVGLNSGPSNKDTEGTLSSSSHAGLTCFMQWHVAHNSACREEVEALLAGEASLPLCSCPSSIKLRRIALRLLRLPEAYASLPPHELGPLLESHWVVVEGAEMEEGACVMQRLLRARDCCRLCYKTHPVAKAFPHMDWRHKPPLEEGEAS
ncbi:hypothetical protein, conserved [Eimeria brunetti]|uniref:Uncharacterized protein n=1 Tax=Eimeria brunetti TaxID=51314 RepID=U6LSY6_9EIME|nr:hypothetical protein, conserved [Eimeria brunetti]